MTRAQQGFADARPEISDLLRTAKNLSDRVEAGRRMSPQENHLRHVVVALIAILQAYVTDLLEERIDQLGDDWHALNEVEKRYVAVQSNRRIKTFLQENAEEDLAIPHKVDSVRTIILACAEWLTKPSALARSAYREKLSGFLQDNGSRVLDRAISGHGRCGLSFFNWLNKNHPRYRGLDDLLNIVIATRNDVAHGTFTRRVTIRDARLYRVLIFRLIAKIQPYMDEPTQDVAGECVAGEGR